MTRRFMPSPRAIFWLATIGLLSLGYALYLRYLVIEQSAVGIACDGGLKNWLCLSRSVASGLFNHQVFGWASLGAAALNLIRPSLALFAIGLMLAAFGVVLYNASLSALAAGLLIMSFARPAHVEE